MVWFAQAVGFGALSQLATGEASARRQSVRNSESVATNNSSGRVKGCQNDSTKHPLHQALGLSLELANFENPFISSSQKTTTTATTTTTPSLLSEFSLT